MRISHIRFHFHEESKTRNTAAPASAPATTAMGRILIRRTLLPLSPNTEKNGGKTGSKTTAQPPPPLNNDRNRRNRIKPTCLRGGPVRLSQLLSLGYLDHVHELEPNLLPVGFVAAEGRALFGAGDVHPWERGSRKDKGRHGKGRRGGECRCEKRAL